MVDRELHLIGQFSDGRRRLRLIGHIEGLPRRGVEFPCAGFACQPAESGCCGCVFELDTHPVGGLRELHRVGDG